jgi:predicted O-methyltransferase YrrM
VEPFFEAKAFLRHKLRASGPHGVHSPFVFDLITQVLNSKKEFYIFEKIESVRSELLADQRTIQVNDLGAGSRELKSDLRKICRIAKNSLQPAASAQALFKMVDHFKPACILELGTSLGITTSYLASATKVPVYTIEGSVEIVSISKEVFSKLKPGNIHSYTGPFKDKLPEVLPQLKQPAFVLMDGDHTYQSTIQYFDLIFSFLREDSVVVLDDIHWSSGMEKAWNEIKSRPAITLSLDFFHFGVLFFRKGRIKEHFSLHLP